MTAACRTSMMQPKWGDTQHWILRRVIKTHNVCGRIGGILTLPRTHLGLQPLGRIHFGQYELLQMEDNFTFQPDNPFRKSFIGSSSLDASFPVLKSEDLLRHRYLLPEPEAAIRRKRSPPSATCWARKIGIQQVSDTGRLKGRAMNQMDDLIKGIHGHLPENS